MFLSNYHHPLSFLPLVPPHSSDPSETCWSPHFSLSLNLLLSGLTSFTSLNSMFNCHNHSLPEWKSLPLSQGPAHLAKPHPGWLPLSTPSHTGPERGKTQNSVECSHSKPKITSEPSACPRGLAKVLRSVVSHLSSPWIHRGLINLCRNELALNNITRFQNETNLILWK